MVGLFLMPAVFILSIMRIYHLPAGFYPTSGITGPNVIDAMETMLSEGPKERLSHQFSLFDRDGDGWLTCSEIELAFNATIDPVQVVAFHVGCSHCFDLMHAATNVHYY